MLAGSIGLAPLSTAHVVDTVLLFMAIEFISLGWIHRRRAGATAMLVTALAPGVCLAIAFRLSVAGFGWPWVAAALAASLPCHVLDLKRRPLIGSNI